MSLEPFAIDPDPAKARLPPRELYFDPSAHAMVVERVLARSWWPLLDAQEPTARLSVSPVVLGPGSLDEPLVLSRDGGGTLRALSNACTHRGALLAEAAGAASKLRCRYHGRCFGLDGRLENAPGFEAALDFPSEEDHLRELPLRRLGPLLFSALCPAVSWEEWVRPVRERFGFLDWEALRLDASSSSDYELDASWALYLDNYLEGLHVPHVHPALARSLDAERYEVETLAWASLQVAEANTADEAFELPEDHPDAGRLIGAYYLFLFPTTLLNLYPWGLSLNVVLPQGPSSVRISFRSWVLDESKRGRGAGAGLHQVELEDEAVVRSSRDGLRGRAWRGGRYAPGHEDALHHFHRLLSRLLFESS